MKKRNNTLTMSRSGHVPTDPFDGQSFSDPINDNILGSSYGFAEPLTASYEDIIVAAEAAFKQLKGEFNPRIAKIWAKFLRELQKHDEEEINISSSKVSSDENWQRIGEKLRVLSNKIIAIGSNGTLIFEGCYDNRPAVVKRLLQSHHEVALKEIQNLKEVDQHQNIVRFYGVECDKDFVYLALERCDCNLDDLIQICCADSSQYELVINDNNKHDCSTRAVTVYREDRLETLRTVLGDVSLSKENGYQPSPLLLKLMRDMVLGLVHLHELGIIHRDLKPQNVLIIKGRTTLCAKLSDMGISKRLPENRSSLSHHSTGCGTSGWKAPERLHHGRQTRAMDLFSLGCILFFCITRGRHPFGHDHDERDMNVKNNNVNLFLVEDFPEALHLVSPLLSPDPRMRPKAVEVLHHPLFWGPEMRLLFLRDTSDIVGENSNLLKALEGTARITLGTKWSGKMVQTWKNKMSDKIINHSRQYLGRDYRYGSVRDLLRLIRNLLSHYGQLPKDIQEIVGPLYGGFDDYFTSRFPYLLIEAYKVVCTYCKEEERFRKYFNGDV